MLQYAYDVNGDAWMYESTAVWMEDQVHDAIDDWVGFLAPPNGWVTTPELPITLEQSPRMYGSGVWNHWLSERYGNDAVRGAWERSRTATPASLRAGRLRGQHRGRRAGRLQRRFARFVDGHRGVARARQRLLGGRELPGRRAPGRDLGRATSRQRIELDHTTFALFDVTPDRRAVRFRMNVTAPRGHVHRHRPGRPHRGRPDGGHAHDALPAAAGRRRPDRSSSPAPAASAASPRWW